uniref:Uncharacterized protein AlNc14C400G11365 n=1 Tax=Albugo laibachii Nc14 TaxID=890382 RepID=F0WYV5_9STRA|nr:conserved hypothetical protein [Albugo laibachii Nc14]|eukprot:CCA26664.1 conserved hypothetical protein [Albugo laibachii Nc14]
MVNDPIVPETTQPIQSLIENTAGEQQNHEIITSATTEPFQKKPRLEQSAGPEKLEAFAGTGLELSSDNSTMNEPTIPPCSIQMENQRLCSICKKTGASFVCAANCGLEAHIECIHPDTIFTLSVGQICGSCAICQQNRSSHEDVQKGGIHGLSRWMREKLVTASQWVSNVRDIFTLIIGLNSLKRANISHNHTQSIKDLIKDRKFTVIDFLGWHPNIESPSVRSSSLCSVCGIRNAPELSDCSRCRRKLVIPSTFAKFSSALLATYYAELVGVSLGTSHIDVFLHISTMRLSYKGLRPVDPEGLEWNLFADQLRMIFGFLEVMSDFGVLQLNSTYFESEIRFIFNGMYIHQAILLNEFELVGRFLQSMKLFGAAFISSHNALINACETFLLGQQLSQNGSWCKEHWTPADQYKATVTCAKALLNPKFRGYGPAHVECQRYLEKWARAARVEIDTEFINTKQLASGIKMKFAEESHLKHLMTLYQDKANEDQAPNFLEAQVLSRLYSLVSSEAPRHHSMKSRISPEKDLLEASHFDQDDAEAADDDMNLQSEDFANKTEGEDEDTLTSLSLNGELEIFSGLKFEGGDVIDLSQPRKITPREGKPLMGFAQSSENDEEKNENIIENVTTNERSPNFYDDYGEESEKHSSNEALLKDSDTSGDNAPQ